MIVKDLETKEEVKLETIEEVKQHFASIGLDIDMDKCEEYEFCEEDLDSDEPIDSVIFETITFKDTVLVCSDFEGGKYHVLAYKNKVDIYSCEKSPHPFKLREGLYIDGKRVNGDKFKDDIFILEIVLTSSLDKCGIKNKKMNNAIIKKASQRSKDNCGNFSNNLNTIKKPEIEPLHSATYNGVLFHDLLLVYKDRRNDYYHIETKHNIVTIYDSCHSPYMAAMPEGLYNIGTSKPLLIDTNNYAETTSLLRSTLSFYLVNRYF